MIPWGKAFQNLLSGHRCDLALADIRELIQEGDRAEFSPGVLLARAIFCDGRRLQAVRVLEPSDVLF